jgi:hypothetical protein
VLALVATACGGETRKLPIVTPADDTAQGDASDAGQNDDAAATACVLPNAYCPGTCAEQGGVCPNIGLGCSGVLAPQFSCGASGSSVDLSCCLPQGESVCDAMLDAAACPQMSFAAHPDDAGGGIRANFWDGWVGCRFTDWTVPITCRCAAVAGGAAWVCDAGA